MQKVQLILALALWLTVATAAAVKAPDVSAAPEAAWIRRVLTLSMICACEM